MSDDVSAAVAWFRESPDERIPWIGSPPMGLFGNAQRHAVAIVQAALADQPPAALPATLALVDDVRRVCEAAGLTGEGLYETSGVQRAWSDRDVRVQLTLIGEDGPPFRCSVRRSSDKPAQRFATIDVRCHPPSSILWAAIAAARGGAA